MTKPEDDDKSTLQSKPSVSMKRIVACAAGGLLIVLASVGILSFAFAILSGFRPWIGDVGRIVFQAGIAIFGWGLIDNRRRRLIIACGIVAVFGGLIVHRSFAERRFDIREERGQYVATYGGMTIHMATNVAHRELMETALSCLSRRRINDSLLNNKTLAILHYESHLNLAADTADTRRQLSEILEELYVLYDGTYFTEDIRVLNNGNESRNPFKKADEGLWVSVIDAMPYLQKGDCPKCHDKSRWKTNSSVSFCERCAKGSWYNTYTELPRTDTPKVEYHLRRLTPVQKGSEGTALPLRIAALDAWVDTSRSTMSWQSRPFSIEYDLGSCQTASVTCVVWTYFSAGITQLTSSHHLEAKTGVIELSSQPSETQISGIGTLRVRLSDEIGRSSEIEIPIAGDEAAVATLRAKYQNHTNCEQGVPDYRRQSAPQSEP